MTPRTDRAEWLGRRGTVAQVVDQEDDCDRDCDDQQHQAQHRYAAPAVRGRKRAWHVTAFR